jgi:hypothetical protein
MISVIVCSVCPDMVKNFSLNLHATIGTPYELLVTDNRSSPRGICTVYNEAAKRAKFPIVCFIHEDVYIHTNNWGKYIIELLSDAEVGLVGVSGSVYKSPYPATWSACHSSFYRSHAIQHFKANEKPVIINSNPGKKEFAEVAVLDGVFLATRKNVFDEIQFDQETFAGFHAYDIDLSFQVSCKYKLLVTYNILLEHFSEGNTDKRWFKDSVILHKKWKKKLPQKTKSVEKKYEDFSDFLSCQSILQETIKNDMGIALASKYFVILIIKYNNYNGLQFAKTTLSYIISKIGGRKIVTLIGFILSSLK